MTRTPTVVDAAAEAAWRLHGFTPEAAAEWGQAGFLAFTSLPWRRAKFTPTDAADWHLHGFATSTAVVWRRAGFTAAVAATYALAGVDPPLAGDVNHRTGTVPETLP